MVDIEQEVWKDIAGYEGLYQVSNMGRVKSLLKKRIIRKHNTSNGYLQVHLYKNKKVKYEYIHRLVATAFCSEKSESRNEVNHIDGDRKNNTYLNLEWCTRSENHSTDLYISRQKTAKAHKAKRVSQFDLSGNFIAEHFGLREAYRATGVRRLSISKCCKNMQKTAGNFVWRYAQTNLPE